MYMNRIISNKSLSYVLKHTIVVVGLSLVMVVIVYFIIDDLLLIYMPQYAADTFNIKLIILGVIPFSLRSQLYYYMHGRDKRKLLVFTDLFSTIVYFLILLYVLKYSKTMENIIFAKLIYYFINAVIIFIFAFIVSKSTSSSPHEST